MKQEQIRKNVTVSFMQKMENNFQINRQLLHKENKSGTSLIIVDYIDFAKSASDKLILAKPICRFSFGVFFTVMD